MILAGAILGGYLGYFTFELFKRRERVRLRAEQEEQRRLSAEWYARRNALGEVNEAAMIFTTGPYAGEDYVQAMAKAAKEGK